MYLTLLYFNIYIYYNIVQLSNIIYVQCIECKVYLVNTLYASNRICLFIVNILKT